MLRHYYNLTKPGIVWGNTIVALAAFLYASDGAPDWTLLFASLVGISSIVAAACVGNNLADRDIDALMERTAEREIPNQIIIPKHALAFMGILLALGSATLVIFTNSLALLVALLGFFVYIFLYTPLKRVTSYATHIGAVAGAVPPVIGYTSVTGTLDQAAIFLFVLLVFWQMSHFFSIALYRLQDYINADIPVLPAVRGLRRTKIEIVVYTILFSCTAILFARLGHAGNVYLVPMSLVCAAWTVAALRGLFRFDTRAWARAMFTFSLVVLLVLSAAIASS